MTDRQQPKQGYIDNLRLSLREQEQLLAELDQQGQRYHGSNRRTEDRTTYRPAQGVIIQMRHPGGSSANYVVAPRNLSRGGLGFLHGSFVYTGTPCIVILKTRGGKAVRVEGKIVNCRYVRGHVHEVGIRFHEPLRLVDFLPPSALGA
ncbi:MAG TPA: PilZ domain-containing protein, partial [bacterium]|nr:PilZ domain-containing protein [bacterium]